jgi:hypothetical protein
VAVEADAAARIEKEIQLTVVCLLVWTGYTNDRKHKMATMNTNSIFNVYAIVWIVQ